MRIKLSILICLLLSLSLAAMALWWAPLNQDEGWYLMAARRVSQGQMPYRDFAFTQAPLFPYVYQFAQPLVQALGLLGGRLFNLFWALMTLWVLVWTCRKACPRNQRALATLLVISLYGLNSFQAQYAVTVKTYTLAAYFLSLSTLGWVSYQHDKKKLTLTLTALALAAATATRITLGLFFIPIGVTLFLNKKQKGHLPYLVFVAAGISGLCLFFSPFIILSPGAMWFGLYEFHTQRVVESYWLIKAGFLSRSAFAFLPALLCSLFILPRWRIWQPGLKTLVAGLVLVSGAHLFSPFPYDDYQIVLYPVLVLLLAVELPRDFPAAFQLKAPSVLLLGCLLFAVANPHYQTWFAGKQDRIWFRSKPQSDLSLLRETAKHLKEIAPDAETILTTDTYLAIEAGLDVPRGLEMGPFSYFPEKEKEQASLLNIFNEERVTELISSRSTPLVALSGYGFTIQSPGILPTPPDQLSRIYDELEKHYRPLSVVENFGQQQTILRIYVRNEPD